MTLILGKLTEKKNNIGIKYSMTKPKKLETFKINLFFILITIVD